MPSADAYKMMASESEHAPPAQDHDFWYTDAGTGYTRPDGIHVSPETALKVSAYMACNRMLSQTVAQLPLMLYERIGDDRRRVARDHPLFGLLHRQPNSWQSSFEFREQGQGYLGMRGNFVAEIIPGRRGFVEQLHPLEAANVKIERLPSKRLRYEYFDEDTGKTRRLTQDEVLHVRGFSLNGWSGISPLKYAADTLGISLSAQRFNRAMFANKTKPGTILEAEGSPTEEEVEVIRRRWERFHTGPMNAYRTAVLSGGVKVKELGLTAEELEFIAGMKFQIEEICRLFLMPPHMVGHLERATFSNIEHQGIQFVVNLIQAWCTRWEQALNRDLILDAEKDRFYFEFNLKGLMRGDNAARSNFYQKGIQSGWLTRNEARKSENLEPLEGLDEPLAPLNMGRAGDDEQDADKKEKE